jgi:hypothetical protein
MPDSLVGIFFTAVKNTEVSGPVDPRDFNETVDSMQALGDAPNAPIRKQPTTEQ